MRIRNPSVRDCRPAEKLVYLAIRSNEPLSQQEIVDRTGLNERAVRTALNDLEDAGLVNVGLNLNDLREKAYRVAADAE